MLPRLSACAVLTAALAYASGARSQEVGGSEQAKVSTFHEVEHGGYAGGEVGILVLHVPGAGAGVANGTVVGVSLGYDFAPWIGVGFFGLAIDAIAPANYGGLGDTGVTGDFSGLLPGLEVRLHLPLADDQNGVDRLFLNLGVGGGVMFFQPRALFPSGHSAAGKADVGLEYFTRLRHLSLGLALEGIGAIPSSAAWRATRAGALAGGSLSPFVRYTF
jgi:hypothetical protein